MGAQEYYQSKEAYIREILSWVREWIKLYRKYAVSLDEDGRLRQLKGSITYGNDLELSLNGQMSDADKSSYEEEAKALRNRLGIFRKKAAASFRHGIAIPMEYLFQVFQLSEAECFCLLLSCSVEFERTMGRMFGLLQDDYKEKYPTLDLCLKIFTAEEERRFEELAAVFSQNSNFSLFIKKPFENGLDPVRLHPRILRFLMNYEEGDPSVEEFATLVFPERIQEPADAEYENEVLIVPLSRAASRKDKKNICFLYGPEGVGKKRLVNRVAAGWNKPVLFIDMRTLWQDKGQADKVTEDVVREMVIRGAVPCCCHFESVQPDDDSREEKNRKKRFMDRLFRQLFRHTDCLFLTSGKMWEGEWNRPELARTDWELQFPSATEQIDLWKRMLEPVFVQSVTPEALSVRFSLTPGRMAEALREACDKSYSLGKEAPGPEELYDTCRRQLVMNMGSHVTRVKAQYQWDELILPERQKKALKRACDQVEYKHLVYDIWGFERKIAYGQGVSMLFYGPPGTGKTMGAQVIANQLSMELYKVDLSSVMSKYIGETEKNLGNIFDEVKKSRSILFFDEADALFGKRTEVKDSHDKYGNAETAYLLQKIEEYQGIVVLATNYMQNFDEAFKRRIKFIIEFPFPLAEYRRKMWEQIFPQQTPMEELDYEYLAENFELSGSSIKNIAVAGAFLAASEGNPVGMRHILPALRDEMIKSGKSMPPESFGEYYGLVSGFC